MHKPEASARRIKMAAGDTRANTRLIRITAGNLRNSSLPIKDLRDFFPRDAIGPAKRNRNGL
jgi:hypothetical protein